MGKLLDGRLLSEDDFDFDGCDDVGFVSPPLMVSECQLTIEIGCLALQGAKDR